MTGRLECDIIEMIKGGVDRLDGLKGAKTFCFFLTEIISIYILYYGFIQKVFAPLDNELYGVWLIVLGCMRRSMYFGIVVYLYIDVC